MCLAVIGGADLACRRAASGLVFTRLEDVPSRDVGLVLGTVRLLASGRTNLHFLHRLEAAAQLYRAGKVRHLILSGDNHVVGYDEPSDMRDALMERGVPERDITLDYAGFRTLDSVLRAHSVFGVDSFVIITEEFHCPRAVWIGRSKGLDVVAFAAPDVALRSWSARVKFREVLANVRCGLDLYLLGTRPKFPGPPEPINLASTP
ncbi:MAG: YdcF family protein [Verrucomicrobiales bacterium]|nr:YdcF family protein [Verrucomicrobiales bacterium]